MMVIEESLDSKIIYPRWSYLLNGIFFEAHNKLGRYCRESQYCDYLAQRFKELEIPFEREVVVGNSGNRIDFIINGMIVLELKAIDIIAREEYYQVQRYFTRDRLEIRFVGQFS